MTTIVIVTEVDPTRKGLTYKIELPDYAMETWWDENRVIQLAVRGEHAFKDENTYEGANTTFVIMHRRKAMETHLLKLTKDELDQVLQSANYDYPEEIAEGQRGRPEKRVLLSTTTRERRTRTLVARQSMI